MSINILEVFILTADAGSFEKASKQLYLSSTALIKQINRLERETHLKLFHRTNRGIVLTTSGKVFYKAATNIIKEYQDAIQLALDLEKTQTETLRLGISMVNPYKHVTDKFHYTTDFYARSTITIVPLECNYKAFADQFTNLGQDVDIIPYILGNQDLDLICDSYCLARLPFRIAVPAKHPLNAKDTLTYSDLEDQTIITLNGNINTYYNDVLQAISANTSNVNFHTTNFFDFNTFDYALRNNYLLLVGDYLKDVHPTLKLHSVDWDFTIPYGIYYSLTPSKLVKDLIHSFSEIGKTGIIEESEIIEF